MKKLLASVVTLTLVLAFAQAQDIKDFTPADFDAFIKDDLKKPFKKEEKDGVVLYAIKGGFNAQYNVNAKSIIFFEKYLFELDYKLSKRTQEQNLQTWNNKAKLSQATLPGFLKQGDDKGAFCRWVIFRGTVDLSKGIDRAKLKAYYDGLDAEFDGFIEHMATNKK